MTTKQEQALAALMTYPTRKAAAAAVGITERTIRGYFKNPEFRARYRDQCFEIVEDAALQSKRLLQKSLAVFEAVMDDPEEKSAVRVQAADRAGEYALRLGEHADIMRELAELREAITPNESDD